MTISDEMKKNRNKQKSFGAVRALVLICACVVFLVSAYKIYRILSEYHKADVQYEDLAEAYTSAGGEGETADNAGGPDTNGEAKPGVEADSGDADPVGPADPADPGADSGDKDAEYGQEDTGLPVPAPRSIDWNGLRALNGDIVAWIYVEAAPAVDYPVVRAADNDYYLHRSVTGEELYAGSIFEDFHNSPDFSDTNTIVYGHNMRNGGMFGTLKTLKDQGTVDASPYFWIFTPGGDHRYRIISVFETSPDSDVYTLFPSNGDEFMKWEQEMVSRSIVACSFEPAADDKVVVLSTCSQNSAARLVVVGRKVF